jgi:dehydrogenase/reductase SDR family member 4
VLYSASKAALIMMTRSWAREFGPGGVRVNAIAPGLIQTDFSAYYWQDDARREEVLGTQSLRRLGQPEDVAGLALFLASDDARFITGQVFVADGGSLG